MCMCAREHSLAPIRTHSPTQSITRSLTHSHTQAKGKQARGFAEGGLGGFCKQWEEQHVTPEDREGFEKLVHPNGMHPTFSNIDFSSVLATLTDLASTLCAHGKGA